LFIKSELAGFLCIVILLRRTLNLHCRRPTTNTSTFTSRTYIAYSQTNNNLLFSVLFFFQSKHNTNVYAALVVIGNFKCCILTAFNQWCCREKL